MRNIYSPLSGMYLLSMAQTIVDLREDLRKYGIDLTFAQACLLYDLAMRAWQESR